MINYLLLAVSLITDTLKNIFINSFSTKSLKRQYDNLVFNCISCIGAVIFFCVCGFKLKISTFSLFLSLIFAVTTMLAQIFTINAMAIGSMSYSVLFTYCGMIIPTLFGVIVYSEQKISIINIIGLIMMLLTFYFGTNPKKDSRITLKWLMYGIGSFICWGLIGVWQQIHQHSAYANELDSFLAYSFTIMFFITFFISLFMKLKTKSKLGFKLKSKVLIYCILSGIFIGVVNKVNLYLSGKIASIILFPILNGGVIILSDIAALVIFREKLTKTQLIGIVLGVVSVCFLSI